MDNNANPIPEFNMEQAMAFARSPAGQQLLALLQQTGGQELQAAIAQAKAGNVSQAQKTLSALLESPEAKRLLAQLVGNK